MCRLFPAFAALMAAVLFAHVAKGQTSRPADPPPVREVVIDNPEKFLDQSPAETTDSPDAASEPVNPFKKTKPWSRPDARPGVLTLAGGKQFAGYVFTTRGRGWRLYDPAKKKYRDIPTIIVRKIEAVVLWERMDPDWRWEKMGDDKKVYTGRFYPNRMLQYKFTLVNGRTLQGAIAQPLTVEWHNERTRFILHKRQKGELDQKLEDIPYVKSIVFSLDKMKQTRAAKLPTRPAASGGGRTRSPLGRG